MGFCPYIIITKAKLQMKLLLNINPKQTPDDSQIQ